MALPSSFDDLIYFNGEVIAEVLEGGGLITFLPETVEDMINNSDTQTGKRAEYIQKWRDEGRI